MNLKIGYGLLFLILCGSINCQFNFKQEIQKLNQRFEIVHLSIDNYIAEQRINVSEIYNNWNIELLKLFGQHMTQTNIILNNTQHALSTHQTSIGDTECLKTLQNNLLEISKNSENVINECANLANYELNWASNNLFIPIANDLSKQSITGRYLTFVQMVEFNMLTQQKYIVEALDETYFYVDANLPDFKELVEDDIRRISEIAGLVIEGVSNCLTSKLDLYYKRLNFVQNGIDSCK